jgi:hypothetical protein
MKLMSQVEITPRKMLNLFSLRLLLNGERGAMRTRQSNYSIRLSIFT